MRMRLVVAFIFLFFVLLLSRIYYLSIKSNIYYEEMAKQNAIKTRFLPPTRGLIKDSKGKLLANNDLGFSIAIKPYLNIKKQNQGLLDEELFVLSQTFPDLNVTLLKRNYIKEDSYYNQDFIDIVDFIPYDEMIPHFSQLNLRENLQITPIVKRRYPYGKLASHIIGYIGKANLQDMNENEIAKLTNYTGKSGIERYYNEILQGQKGVREVKVDAHNKEIEEISFQKTNSNDISLTIDIQLQSFLSELFADNAGVAIIMEANTGAILAAGSFPEYDLNPFVTGISVQDWKELSNSPDHPFTNKMVNGLYPPGSIIKMGTALAFLNSRSINTATEFYCAGLIELGGRNFRCWNRSGHGDMNLKHAIAQSCDVYFYEGGLKVGIDQISSTLGKIGFGSKTGVDLPNEFVGTVPSKEWKMQRYKQPWYQGETLNTSIGQGNFLVTPIQVAKYTAQIAVGKNVNPHFLKEIEGELDENTRKAYQIQDKEEDELFNVFEKSQLPALREAMLAVTKQEGGTAYRFFKDLPLSVAGKTGTAQVVGFSQAEKRNIREKDLKYYSRSHTWLTSFAPYKKPQYVVSVLLEHGGRSISSGELTAAIYRKMLELKYFENEK
ncbi:penicillin-binding protein 2 [Campylobacter sp. MIT 12-8780]|uniref:penicillin-binding protein 2 n=1 Tax=Campylobacter sp. MIT 12-8780 TaxID=2202200 RepID=UPI00115D81B4|nr:penicillin-binding protein 2 [Campylobacter sp. MIT 12-8780]TQR40595.1 penicillin-binding protein 2 [Campylobacter sp. MIT 12-8780]